MAVIVSGSATCVVALVIIYFSYRI